MMQLLCHSHSGLASPQQNEIKDKYFSKIIVFFYFHCIKNIRKCAASGCRNSENTAEALKWLEKFFTQIGALI